MSHSVHIARPWCALRGIALLCTFFIAGTPLPATEPVGRVVLEASWVDGKAGFDANRRLLRLSVKPLVALEEWTLTVTAPDTFDIRAQAPPVRSGFRDVPAGDRRRAIRAEMPGVVAAERLTLEFEVIYPPAGGGTVSLIVEGGRKAGHRFHEAVGITARPSAPAPVRRLGAAEFPANVLPPAPPR